MPEQFKEFLVYGPYRGKDGRDRVILRKNGKNRTMSYPKFLWWKEKGELIEYNEHIHHKDEMPQNNSINNFEKISWHKHMALHVKSEKFICKWCEKEFELKGSKLSRRKTNKKLKGNEGPFCCKQCAGKYGAYVQYTIKGMKSMGGRKPYRLKNLANKLYRMRQV